MGFIRKDSFRHFACFAPFGTLLFLFFRQRMGFEITTGLEVYLVRSGFDYFVGYGVPEMFHAGDRQAVGTLFFSFTEGTSNTFDAIVGMYSSHSNEYLTPDGLLNI